MPAGELVIVPEPVPDLTVVRVRSMTGTELVSTVNMRVAGVWSVLAAASVARTAKVWGPSVNAATVTGLEQVEKVPASTLH
jgi:hypothetical protein